MTEAADSNLTSGSKTTSSVTNTAHHIETVIHQWHFSFNARDISPTAPTWDQFAPEFRMVIQGPSALTSFATPEMDLVEFAIWARTIAEEYPKFHIKPVDHHVSVDGDWAKVFVTSEIHGMPEGIVRPDMGVFTLNKCEGESEQGQGNGGGGGVWRICRIETFARPAGMFFGSDGGGAG